MGSQTSKTPKTIEHQMSQQMSQLTMYGGSVSEMKNCIGITRVSSQTQSLVNQDKAVDSVARRLIELYDLNPVNITELQLQRVSVSPYSLEATKWFAAFNRVPNKTCIVASRIDRFSRTGNFWNRLFGMVVRSNWVLVCADYYLQDQPHPHAVLHADADKRTFAFWNEQANAACVESDRTSERVRLANRMDPTISLRGHNTRARNKVADLRKSIAQLEAKLAGNPKYLVCLKVVKLLRSGVDTADQKVMELIGNFTGLFGDHTFASFYRRGGWLRVPTLNDAHFRNNRIRYGMFTILCGDVEWGTSDLNNPSHKELIDETFAVLVLKEKVEKLEQKQQDLTAKIDAIRKRSDDLDTKDDTKDDTGCGSKRFRRA
mgnify:CR=1 FL=1